VSGNVYVLVNTACAVREKDHKIFEFPENLVRKKKNVSNSANFCQPMTHLLPCEIFTSFFASEANDILRSF